VKSLWLIFTLLMPMAAAFAAEQPAIDPNQRIIQMDGRGEVRAAPDQASVSFAIETKSSTAQEAGTQNAQIAQRVIAALKSKIGAGGKVETAGYSLTPLYAAGDQSDRIRDWIAANTVSVECDPSIAGSVLDAAHAAGGVGSSSIDDNSGKATMDFQITATALTATEAIKSSAEQAQRVNEAVKGKLAGKGSSQIKPGNVQGEHESNRNQMEIIGYQASNSISAQTTAIDQVGSMIDAAMAAGATRANFVNFSLRDDSKARSDAMADACKDAQLKANAAAQALGLKVKRILRVTSVNGGMPLQGGYSTGVVSDFAVATPIKPSDLTVPATVTVTYELE
jgi:uncharacterized protein YggE